MASTAEQRLSCGSEGLTYGRYLTDDISDEQLEGEVLNAVNDEYFSVFSQLAHAQALLKLLELPSPLPVADSAVAEFELEQEEGELAERLQAEMQRFAVPEEQADTIDHIASLVSNLVDASGAIAAALEASSSADADADHAAYQQELTSVAAWYQSCTALYERLGGIEIVDWQSQRVYLRDVYNDTSIVVELRPHSNIIDTVVVTPTSPQIEHAVATQLAIDSSDLQRIFSIIRETK